MDVRMEKKDTNSVKLEVKVPNEEFQKGIDKAYHKNVGKFNIPGFRRGKAPKDIVERMYGEEVFYEDAVNFVIDETYPEAVKNSKIEPVDRPEIDIVDIGKDKDLVYTATVIVKPEVELGEYKGLEVKKEEYPVKDEDVDKQLKQMQERNARIITKEDGIVDNGNIAVIDFEGSIDGVPFEGGKGTNHQLEIGSGSFIKGFEEQLIGKKSGEDVDVNVTFPEDYRAKDVAGKPALFKVKIKEVKYKELPALDDEFAKDVSEFGTLEELKSDTKKKMEENSQQMSKRKFEDDAVKKAVENAKVEIPEVMVQREIDFMLEDINYRLSFQGLTLEKYAGLVNTTVDKMREEYRSMAYDKVKTQLVLEKIGAVESISVTDDEIDKEIEKAAKQYGQDKEKFKAQLNDSAMKTIKKDIAANKAVDFIVQNAKNIA